MVFSLQTLKKISCGPVDDIAPGGMMSLAVALHSGVPPVEVKVPCDIPFDVVRRCKMKLASNRLRLRFYR